MLGCDNAEADLTKIVAEELQEEAFADEYSVLSLEFRERLVGDSPAV